MHFTCCLCLYCILFILGVLAVCNVWKHFIFCESLQYVHACDPLYSAHPVPARIQPSQFVLSSQLDWCYRDHYHCALHHYQLLIRHLQQWLRHFPNSIRPHTWLFKTIYSWLGTSLLFHRRKMKIALDHSHCSIICSLHDCFHLDGGEYFKSRADLRAKA